MKLRSMRYLYQSEQRGSDHCSPSRVTHRYVSKPKPYSPLCLIRPDLDEKTSFPLSPFSPIRVCSPLPDPAAADKTTPLTMFCAQGNIITQGNEIQSRADLPLYYCTVQYFVSTRLIQRRLYSCQPMAKAGDVVPMLGTKRNSAAKALYGPIHSYWQVSTYCTTCVLNQGLEPGSA